ncbi:m06 protein [Murid betaherpesvirus 1]|nr:m06 protein [Murid betaherpesvirus 1]
METTARMYTRSRSSHLLALVTVLVSLTLPTGGTMLPTASFGFIDILRDKHSMNIGAAPSNKSVFVCNITRFAIQLFQHQTETIRRQFKCFDKDGVRQSLVMTTTGENRFSCKIPDNAYVNATWYVEWIVGDIAASVSPVVYFESTTSSSPTSSSPKPYDTKRYPFFRRKIVTGVDGFTIDEKTGDISVSRAKASLADSVRCRLRVCLWTKNASILRLPNDDPQMKNLSDVLKLLPDYSGPDLSLPDEGSKFDYDAWRQRMRTEMEEPSRRRRQLLLVISVIASLLWLAVGAMLFYYIYGHELLVRLLKRYGKQLVVRGDADGKDQSLTSPLLTK